MTEPTPADPTTSAPTEATAQPPQEIDWKVEARKWEQRAKGNAAQVNELKPYADQFRQLEEASKSEAQRLAEAAETARRDAETARAEAVRYKAAATHGIPASHFDLLGTGSEEDLTARAEKLSQLLAAAQQQPPAAAPSSRPVEQLRPGATPTEAVSADDAVWTSLFGPPK